MAIKDIVVASALPVLQVIIMAGAGVVAVQKVCPLEGGE